MIDRARKFSVAPMMDGDDDRRITICCPRTHAPRLASWSELTLSSFHALAARLADVDAGHVAAALAAGAVAVG